MEVLFIRKLVGASLMIALLLIPSACSNVSLDQVSGAPTFPTGGVSSAPSTPDSPSSASKAPSETVSPTPKPKEFNVINWILGLGVKAPSGPTYEDFQLYQALSSRECEQGGNPAAFPVLAAALSACRAAEAGADARQEWWDMAARVRDTTDPTTLNCMDAKAYEILRALVDAHRKYPDLPFQFASPGPTARPTCLVIATRSPAVGRPGTIITVSGHNLDRATQVTLVDSGRATPARVLEKSDGELRFKIPEDLTHSGHHFLITWKDATGRTEAWGPLEFGPNGDTQSPDPPQNEATPSADKAPTASRSQSPLPKDTASPKSERSTAAATREGSSKAVSPGSEE